MPDATQINAERLQGFAKTLVDRRKEAIDGRQQSGIEDDWREDQDFYDGLDDANRDEKKYTKGASLNAGLTSIKTEDAGARSTVFLNITAPYVDGAAARVSDMLLPTDDRNWAIKPTPIPELAQALKDDSTMQPTAGGQPAVNADGSPVQVSRKDYAQQILDQANERAEAAQKRIDDWLTECQWHAQCRELIQNCTTLGSGVVKGPFPKKMRDRAFFRNGQAAALKVVEKLQPASKRISCWDLFPDPACGESIHNGSYMWERDRVTAKQLKELKGTPGYLGDQIDAVIAEGPKKSSETPSPDQPADDKEQYEIWYYTGNIRKTDLEACGCQVTEDSPNVSGLVTLVNDHVIKAVLTPMDTDGFPYDIMPWKKRPGMPWGAGVARQIRTAQRMLNAGVRNMMDNAGYSSGPIIIVNRKAIEPADGDWTMSVRKLFYTKTDQEVEDVNKIFAAFNVPTMQKELLAIIQFALKIAEDVTGLPLLMQGQQGKAPDTVGGMTILNNNASTVLRRIAKLFDDYITEPHIRRYYQFLLEHGPDDNEKGDMLVDARGSSALVERDLQNQLIQQLLPYSANPIYGNDPKKCMAEYLKSQHLDAKRFQFDDAKWQKVVEGLTQAAQKRAPGEGAAQAAQIKEQGAMQRQQDEHQFEAQENEKDRENKVALEMIQAKINTLELDSVERQVLEKLKTSLGETVIKVRAQEKLSAQDAALQVHKHHTPAAVAPPTEPAGNAAPGHAFQA
jgi:hypothetical protein